MTDSERIDLKERTSLAIKKCEEYIAWFAKHKREARLLHRSSQVSVIALGALTPILIMISETGPGSLPKWLQALPATVSAIVAGLSAVFHWKESWVSRVVALESLESELFKFKTKTSQYYSPEISAQKALENFVLRVDQINQEELGNWRSRQVRDAAAKADGNKQ